jgi:DNA-binding HxlR family transcriptional regulator
MSRSLAPHLPLRDTLQFLVDHGQQSIERRSISPLQNLQKLRDLNGASLISYRHLSRYISALEKLALVERVDDRERSVRTAGPTAFGLTSSA